MMGTLAVKGLIERSGMHEAGRVKILPKQKLERPPLLDGKYFSAQINKTITTVLEPFQISS